MEKLKIDMERISFKVRTDFSSNNEFDVEIYPVYIDIVYENWDSDDDDTIGTLSGHLLSNAVPNDCYEAMDHHSYELCDLAGNFIMACDDDDNDDEYGYIKEWVVNIGEYKDVNVLCVNRVEIDEQYRGNGILKYLTNTLLKAFKCPIILKAYPLQFEGIDDQPKEFKKASLKLRKAYMNSGFAPLKRGSEYMYIAEHELIQEKNLV